MSVARRILILTADAGFGHRSAAEAIAAALRETCGQRCVVDIVNAMADKRVPAFLRHSQTDYDRIVRDVPELYKLGYEASDATVPSMVVETALTVMLFEVMYDLVCNNGPAVIVTTYPLYQAPLWAVYTIIGRRIPLITVVTDLVTVHRLWFHDGVDACLVPTVAVRAAALAAGLAADKVHITGIPVHPDLARQERSQAAIRAELGWQPERTTVLAVGSRRVRNLMGGLQMLNHSGLPLQLAVVAGGDDELYRQLTEIHWHVPVHLYHFVEHMPKLMHAADLVMCKAGGLIVTEALACGLPLLLIDALPGQEQGNADYVVNGGAGELVESPDAVLATVFHWLERGGALLAERAEKARQLGRPRAAYEVAGHVWAAAECTTEPRNLHSTSRRSKLLALLARYGVTLQDKPETGRRGEEANGSPPIMRRPHA